MAFGQPLLVVPDGAACARWESVWLARPPRRGAWFRPPVTTVHEAVDALWLDHRRSGADEEIISETQSAAVWEQVVLESPHGRSLISARYAARAAREAWTLWHQFEIRRRALEPYPDEADFSAFLDWCSDYRRVLDAERWIDGALAIDRMRSAVSPRRREIGVSGIEQLPPATAALLGARSAFGHVEAIEPGGDRGHIRMLRTQDRHSELAAAAEWADFRLHAGHGSSVVALVVPDARLRAAEIDTVLGDLGEAAGPGRSGPPVWRAAGDRAVEFPAIGAAISALECLSDRGGFHPFSRWLRSPFLEPDGCESATRRAAFDAGFRRDLRAQWRFVEAYRHGGLSATLRDALPVFAAAAERALRGLEYGGRLRFPSEWAAAWEQSLRALGWRPERLGTPAEALAAWDGALQSFASLSAVLGAISGATALDRFNRLLETMAVRRPMPTSGIHVFERAEQIGPGYAGIWITGFTDRLWPAPVQLNPVLPSRLQRGHDMPLSTPALAQRRSEQVLERVLKTAAEIVVSSPAQVEDVEVLPSTMLDGFEPADYLRPDPGTRATYCSGRLGSRRRLGVTEAMPRTAPGKLDGGMRVLALQSACPLRAFCEVGLGAVPLEAPRRGVPRRTRGVILHRALELLFGPFAGAGPLAIEEVRSGVGDAVRRAVAESIGHVRRPWDLIVEIEVQRTESAVGRFLEREAERDPFEVVAVERHVVLEMGGWSLNGRIDRIDRLDDGRLVIVDYKTGALPPAAGWFAERIRNPQVPAYALTQAVSVSACVVVSIGEDSVDCRAAGDLPDDFPARARPALSGTAWQAQLERWHEQIAALLEEYGAGDARIFLADTSLAERPYATLTRIDAARAAGAGRSAR